METLQIVTQIQALTSIQKSVLGLQVLTLQSRTRDLEEKKRGLAAKARLIEILESANEIHLDSHGVGKYGRVLGQLHVSDESSPTMLNVNELLIKEGHAVEYHGGKR